MRFFQLASKIPEVYFPSASAKTGKRSLNFVLRWAAKGQMHNKERYIERGVHKEQIRSSEELSWGRMAARTNTNISWLDWSKFCSFIALVGESSAMSSRTSWRPPTAHNSPPPPLENPARSQLVSQLQFTSISLRLLRFSLHTFWGGKWRELSLQL